MPKRTPRFNIAPRTASAVVSRNSGYGSEWKKLRNKRLDAEPLCRHCTGEGLVTPAIEVDHIKPKALGGGDTWDNTQSLCKPCHQDKTRQDIRSIRRGY
ncbi:HNH endonuclease signature motif containing protein [Sphingomonas xinjiangensis]|uniref:HNH endonuclease n=1 Tax=Sphingomonas xinjiangensis TaxID=643568 RepID=UPI00160F1221